MRLANTLVQVPRNSIMLGLDEVFFYQELCFLSKPITVENKYARVDLVLYLWWSKPLSKHIHVRLRFETNTNDAGSLATKIWITSPYHFDCPFATAIRQNLLSNPQSQTKMMNRLFRGFFKCDAHSLNAKNFQIGQQACAPPISFFSVEKVTLRLLAPTQKERANWLHHARVELSFTPPLGWLCNDSYHLL